MWQPPAWSLTWRSGRAAGLGLVGRPYSAHLNDLVQWCLWPETMDVDLSSEHLEGISEGR